MKVRAMLCMYTICCKMFSNFLFGSQFMSLFFFHNSVYYTFCMYCTLKLLHLNLLKRTSQSLLLCAFSSAIFWVEISVFLSSLHLLYNISGFFWPPICFSARNSWCSRSSIRVSSQWILSRNKTGFSCMGWFWPWILYQLSEPSRMEKVIHCFWLCVAGGYGNCRENSSAPHKIRCLERS